MAAVAGVANAYEPLINYQLQCMGCHLTDGSGQPGRVPSVRRSLVNFSKSAEGRNFVIRVPGVAQSPLSDTETALLLNWMALTLSDPPPPSDFKAYSAAEVHALRGRPLTEVKATRKRLLKTTLSASPPSR